jgi:alpha-tubulin suppressor-like RCC1 family protein
VLPGKTSSSTVTRRVLRTITWSFAGVAAITLAAGCSSGGAGGTKSPPRVTRITTTAEHWGSFFGGPPGNFDTQASPTAVSLPGAVSAVATSNSTQYALLTDGEVYAWGLGNVGQLGDGTKTNSFAQPVQVQFPKGVRIAKIPTDVMPFDTGLAIDTTGRVWGWGRNGGGDLCLGNARVYTKPVELPLAHVTAVAGASNHALYDAGRTVFACGQNVAGDLGDGSERSSTTPVRVRDLNGLAVKSLVAAFANSGALLANGEYLDWGYNAKGQLGVGYAGKASDVPVRVPLPMAVTQAAQGGSIWFNGQTLVMLSNGSLWAWGADDFCQLGDGRTKARPSPESVRFPAGITYRSIATGSATSYAISATGSVYAWGTGFLGQVGNGRTTTACQPVQVASGATAISATANDVVVSLGGTNHSQSVPSPRA